MKAQTERLNSTVPSPLRPGGQRLPFCPAQGKSALASTSLLLGLLLTLLCPAPLALAESRLGRLFFTPERRQQLDYQRQMNIQPEPEVVPQDPMLTINGVVTRSSGKRTLWINGMALSEDSDLSDLELVPVPAEPGRLIVHASENPTAQASVGDTLNRNTGATTDLLNGGRIRIRRQP